MPAGSSCSRMVLLRLQKLPSPDKRRPNRVKVDTPLRHCRGLQVNTAVSLCWTHLPVHFGRLMMGQYVTFFPSLCLVSNVCAFGARLSAATAEAKFCRLRQKDVSMRQLLKEWAETLPPLQQQPVSLPLGWAPRKTRHFGSRNQGGEFFAVIACLWVEHFLLWIQTHAVF